LLGAYYKGKHCVQQNKKQELMLLIDYGTQLMHVNTGVLLFYVWLFSKGIVTCFRQIRLNITILG